MAKQAGLTVRTLHHYDGIGLFSPSRMTEGGHRVYTEGDVSRLQQIILFKQLGFSLEHIKEMLKNTANNPVKLLEMQLGRLNDGIDHMLRLRDQVKEIIAIAGSGETVSSQRLMIVMQMTKLLNSPHFDSEQADILKRQFQSSRIEELDDNQLEGNQLIADFREMLRLGKAPGDIAVQELAERWKRGMEQFVPADDEFVRSAESYYNENPLEAAQYGMDGELYAYIKKAVSLL